MRTRQKASSRRRLSWPSFKFAVLLLLLPGCDRRISPTDLYPAVQNGDVSTVKKYLAEGGDPNHIFKKHRFGPAHLAAAKGQVEVLELLLDHGADPNLTTTDPSHMTPLMHASMHTGPPPPQTLAAAELLLRRGAEIDHQGNPGERTALSRAASTGYTEMVALLIAHGADVNYVDSAGQTALHWLAIFGGDKPELAKLLLDAGARVDIRDRWGKTPLDNARQYKREGLIALLEAAQSGAKGPADR